MKNIISIVVALMVSLASFGQDVQTTTEAAPEKAAPCIKDDCDKDCGFGMDLVTTVTLYDFADGSVVAVKPELSIDVLEKFTVGASLPFYNDNNSFFSPSELTWMLSNGIDVPTGTGFGDLEFFATYHLFDGKLDMISVCDKVWLDITGGFAVPLDGVYSSDDNIFNIGGLVGGKFGEVNLTHKFKYSFVNDYTYVAAFGGFSRGDLYTGVSSVSWNANKDLSFAFSATQYASEDYNVLLIGPSLTWDITQRASLEAGVGVPLDDEIPGGELDAVFNVGLGLKF